MLRTQRLLAFSSRVHTYFLLLLCFFFLAFLAGSYFAVDEAYIDLLLLCHDVVLWVILVMGLWIFVLGIVLSIGSGIVPVKLMVLDVARIAAASVVSYAMSCIQHLVTQGIVIGF